MPSATHHKPLAHVFMMNVAPLEAQEETPRENTGAASSSWQHIPTESSLTIPSSTSPQPETRESEGEASHDVPRPQVSSNVWTQEFNRLANEGITQFQHPNQSYTGHQLPIGPPNILGGQYVRQDNFQPPIPKAPPLVLQQQVPNE